MSDAAARQLLVIADPAPWVPPPGGSVGERPLRVSRVAGLDAAAALPPQPWDVVAFSIEALDSGPPVEVLAALRRLAPDATFLPISRRPDPHQAIAYLKNGAFEYLEEPLSAEDFLRAVAEALENREAFREILELNQTLERQKRELVEEKRELERKNRELEAVSRLSRALASTLDLPTVLDQLTRCIRDTLEFERIVVGLVDPGGECEEVKAVLSGEDAADGNGFGELRWPLGAAGGGSGWIATVFEQRRTLRIDDPASHPLTRGTPLAEVHHRAFAKLPMVVQGRVVGTITVEHGPPDRRIDDEDLRILEIFSDTAALAVENARLYQSMKELSVRDELTGLYNRRHLLRQLDAECQDARRHGMPLALLMLDIDHFKQLNDGNDHLTGDAALRKLAALLLRNTRGIDTVARYGGEEFVVVLPRTSKENSLVVGEKLRRLVERTTFEGEETVPAGTLTVSVGAASHPGDARTPEELMERADWALYRAKASGRNRVQSWEGDQRAHAS